MFSPFAVESVSVEQFLGYLVYGFQWALALIVAWWLVIVLCIVGMFCIVLLIMAVAYSRQKSHMNSLTPNLLRSMTRRR